MGKWALLLIVASCQTHHLYEGPERPDAELARIKSYTRKHYAVYLKDPHGTVSWKKGGWIALPPGSHWLHADIRWRGSGLSGFAGFFIGSGGSVMDPRKSVDLRFVVEAGKRYDLEIHWIDERYEYQVTDAETGRLVGGVRIQTHAFASPTIVRASSD